MATRLYIVLRSDLIGMSPGRAAAQASHGTSDFHETLETPFAHLPTHYEMKTAFNEWKEEAGNFGTAIVLKGTYAEIIDLMDAAADARQVDPSKYHFYSRKIVDPQYFYKGPGEMFEAKDVTTGAVFFIPDPVKSSELATLSEKVRVLPLY